MRRFKRRPIILVVLASAVGVTAGCGTQSTFFRVRNPFDIEADAIAAHRARSRSKRSAPEREMAAEPDPAPPRPSHPPYFGQGTSSPEVPFLPKKKPPAESGKPIAAEAEAAVPNPPAHPPSRETITASPRPAAAGGAVCYRCNGKGRYLSSLTPDGRLMECADCAGTGRR